MASTYEQEVEAGHSADPLIPYVPRVPLPVIVLVHFTLTVFACQTMAGTMWISYSYAFTNFFVLAMGCWAIGQFQPPTACFMFLVSMLISIIIDLELIIVYYPRAEDIINGLYPSLSSELTFSLVMACFNIILKVPSSICIYNHLKLRGGIFIMGFLAEYGFVGSVPSGRQHNDPERGTQQPGDVTIEAPPANFGNPNYEG
ncbi:type-1 angiotensin II receptor-associated protein-like [Ptychodera flava]|uniref:type-1 angiotensin II receptor-associated protein-like n=1 Tax=Ptychodera flava TaxID=63121 RepID=UPI00396A21B0